MHTHIGGEQKATIHKTIPGSRPRTELPLDPNSPDDLTHIRGINRALAEKLRRTGITHFEQIAEWSPTDVRSLSAALNLSRSIYTQNWIEQAARLTRLRGGTMTRARDQPATEAAGHPASNQTKSIASLVASAASAIRARLRMNQPVADPSGIGLKPAASPSIPLAATPLLPPSPIDPRELATRIADRFRRIGTAVGIAEAAFPEWKTSRVAIQGSVPVKGPSAGAEPALEPVSDSNPEPVLALLPVEIEPALPSTKSVVSTPPSHQPPRVETAPTPEPTIAPAPAAKTAPRLPDDLCLISHLSQDVSDRLNALGVHYFSDIASFNADDIAALSVDCDLGERINRECWVEQAAMLATGAVTKAASLRMRAEISCLTPYPSAPLQRYPDAFATLIPSPVVSLSDSATLAIQSEDPAESEAAPSPEPPPDMPARELATLVETKTAATAQKPPKPSPPPVVIETTATVLIVADLPPAIEPQAALADTPSEHAPAQEPPQTPDEAAPEHLSDERHAEFPEYEEAEVTIRPRTPLQFTASPGCSKPGARPDQESIDFADSADPGSLTSKPPHGEESTDGNSDGQAGYLMHVGEASVDIVPARPTTAHSNHRPSQATAPDGGMAATPADAAGVPKPVNRFFNALRGR